MRLVAEGLSATRGGRTVFAGLDLGIVSGEALILKGPNGAGKSTLLRILAGFGEASAGTIRLEGADPERQRGEYCHYAAHADAVKPALTAAENLDFWAAWFGGGDSAGALAALDIAHLADIPAGLFSAGQKRRLGLARLKLAHRPIWLLDEPAVSLDAAAADILAALMQDHVASGGILIAATHQPLGIETARELVLSGRMAA